MRGAGFGCRVWWEPNLAHIRWISLVLGMTIPVTANPYIR